VKTDRASALRPNEQQVGIESMAVWQNGPGRIYVGFGKVVAGDPAPGSPSTPASAPTRPSIKEESSPMVGSIKSTTTRN